MGILLKLFAFIVLIGISVCFAAVFGLFLFLHGIWSKMKGPFKDGFYGDAARVKTASTIDYRDDIKQLRDTLKSKGYLKRRRAPVTLVEDEVVRDMMVRLSAVLEDPHEAVEKMGLKVCWERDFINAPSERAVVITPSKYGILI